jgi:hypothetical protein
VTLRLPFRRTFAALLLPASLLPVLLLAPSLARAPATLVLRLERAITPAHHARRRGPGELPRYPIGASRLEVDAFAPAAGVLTPQVGVSPLLEHAGAVRGAYEPVVLIVGGRESGAARRRETGAASGQGAPSQ